MKTCTNCRKTKPITDFNKNRGSHRNQCKDCRKAKGHFRKKRFKDGHYSVYYLPEHHYVGMTNSIRARMQETPIQTQKDYRGLRDYRYLRKSS